LNAKTWAALVLLACAALPALAQTPRVLIVGDSWAEEMWLDGAHEVVFSSNGLGRWSALGTTTTESGSTAAQWRQPDQLQRIGDALAANPDIDIVQLTVGGNDFLDAWSTTLPEAQVDTLQQAILADLQTITDYILAQRADIEVLLSFYDYPNFRDTRSGLLGLLFCTPLWNQLGQPTPTQLNAAAIDFVDLYAGIAAQQPRIHHVRHFGLMQSRYGIDQLPPGQLQPPGDPLLPSPLAAMRDRAGLGRDCFHLAPEGYDTLVQNLVDGYYRRRFESIFSDSFG
jgi:lysophospholipase L1-like esterase